MQQLLTVCEVGCIIMCPHAGNYGCAPCYGRRKAGTMIPGRETHGLWFCSKMGKHVGPSLIQDHTLGIDNKKIIFPLLTLNWLTKVADKLDIWRSGMAETSWRQFCLFDDLKYNSKNLLENFLRKKKYDLFSLPEHQVPLSLHLTHCWLSLERSQTQIQERADHPTPTGHMVSIHQTLYVSHTMYNMSAYLNTPTFTEQLWSAFKQVKPVLLDSAHILLFLQTPVFHITYCPCK